LITVHSIVLPVSTKPLPLQAFWPLQAFEALLQALCPLQAFAPLQTTPPAEAAVAKVPMANAVAAAVNIVRFVMIVSLLTPHHSLDADRETMNRTAGPHNI